MTPKLNERVMNVIGGTVKGLKPRPAVDRILTARLTGKWTHYAQVLLAYSPTEFGIAYVNLDKPSEPQIKIHDAASKAGKFATAKELKRLEKAEKQLARKVKAEAVKVVQCDPKLPTSSNQTARMVKKARKPAVKS
jgi:hypothetical protein